MATGSSGYTRPEAGHVALARSDRDGTSQANCCPQSSYAPHEDLDENTRLVDSVHRERLSLLRGKGGVTFDELRHDITCCLKTH